MTSCLFCSKDHPHSECPMFGKTDAFLAAYAPSSDTPPPQSAKRSSLAQTQLEELYGDDALAVLDRIDGDEDYSPEERQLAEDILTGNKSFKELDHEERRQLDEMAIRFATGPTQSTRERSQADAVRSPPYVATQAEMEDMSSARPEPVEPLPQDPFAYLKNVNDPT